MRFRKNYIPSEQTKTYGPMSKNRYGSKARMAAKNIAVKVEPEAKIQTSTPITNG